MHPLGILTTIIVLDLLFGDPVYRFHPVRLFADLLNFIEKRLFKMGQNRFAGGVIIVVLMITIVLTVVVGLHAALGQCSTWVAVLWYLYVGYSLIAIRDLGVHGRRLAFASASESLEEARFHASMLVGRDVDMMDIPACNRACVESLSENLTDGILAPIFYYLIFGIPGMVLFKVVSTLDSSIGYKNEKYSKFGWCAAKLDDLLNYIPARLSLIVIAIAARFVKGCSAQSAWTVGLSQHDLLESPNSGWSEAAAAGALQIKLGGPVWRDGELDGETWIGESSHPQGASTDHIYRMINIVNYATLIFTAVGAAVWMLVN